MQIFKNKHQRTAGTDVQSKTFDSRFDCNEHSDARERSSSNEELRSQVQSQPSLLPKAKTLLDSNNKDQGSGEV